MSFECDLSWAHRRKSVDHSEPVSPSWSDRENFQGGVGHESSVGVSELSFAVDQNWFGVLSGIDGETAGVPLGGVFVEPVADEHNVGGQIVVV